MIHRGRAPIHLLNVDHGQEVDLELDVQKTQNYVQPKKKYVPFAGGGQRLGSPTPGGPSADTVTVAPAAPTAQTTASASGPRVTLDPSQPTLRLQIRLGDGGRLQSQFNPTHTIGDIYEFVDQSRPEVTRPYTLATTFPNKDHDDKSLTLSDVDALKKGGVVVQKWK
jgi:UBX domain-containing protein 1